MRQQIQKLYIHNIAAAANVLQPKWPLGAAPARVRSVQVTPHRSSLRLTCLARKHSLVPDKHDAVAGGSAALGGVWCWRQRHAPAVPRHATCEPAFRVV